MFEGIISWTINMLIISLIVALEDKRIGYRIEEKPLLAFFLAFILPTILEIASYYITGKPFIWALLGM